MYTKPLENQVKLTKSEIKILQCITSFSDYCDSIFPSRERIAKQTGVSTKTVSRSTTRLHNLGFIIKKEIRTGLKRNCIYKVLRPMKKKENLNSKFLDAGLKFPIGIIRSVCDKIKNVPIVNSSLSYKKKEVGSSILREIIYEENSNSVTSRNIQMESDTKAGELQRRKNHPPFPFLKKIEEKVVYASKNVELTPEDLKEYTSMTYGHEEIEEIEEAKKRKKRRKTWYSWDIINFLTKPFKGNMYYDLETPAIKKVCEKYKLTKAGKAHLRAVNDDLILELLEELENHPEVVNPVSYIIDAADHMDKTNWGRCYQIKEQCGVDKKDRNFIEGEFVSTKREKYSSFNKEKVQPRATDPEKERYGRISSERSEVEKSVTNKRDEIYCREIQRGVWNNIITLQEGQVKVNLRLAQSEFRYILTQSPAPGQLEEMEEMDLFKELEDMREYATTTTGRKLMQWNCLDIPSKLEKIIKKNRSHPEVVRFMKEFPYFERFFE